MQLMCLAAACFLLRGRGCAHACCAALRERVRMKTRSICLISVPKGECSRTSSKFLIDLHTDNYVRVGIAEISFFAQPAVCACVIGCAATTQHTKNSHHRPRHCGPRCAPPTFDPAQRWRNAVAFVGKRRIQPVYIALLM
jgi:hypothetical protein